MSKKNYGGLIIPKEFIFNLLQNENGPFVEGLAISLVSPKSVDLVLYTTLNDQNDNLIRIEEYNITDKQVVSGEIAPFAIEEGSPNDYIFLRSDTTLANQETKEPFVFAYFTKTDLTALLNSESVSHLLITYRQ